MDINFKPSKAQMRALKQKEVSLGVVRRLCQKFSYSSDGEYTSEHDFLLFAYVELGFAEKKTEVKVRNKVTGESIIPSEWKPSEKVINSLKADGADIDMILLESKLFKAFWISRNEARHNWDVQFIKRISWLQNNSFSAPSKSRSTKDITIGEMLNDTSWAG
jgi:hypothetical protein